MLSFYPRFVATVHSNPNLLFFIAVPKKATHSCRRTSSSTKSFEKSRTFGDYFSALRLKAANALTSTLPKDERNLLLDKWSSDRIIGGVVNSDITLQLREESDEDYSSITSYQPSIDEAIAATKIREAEKYEQKWERDKEALILEAEEAARRRIEGDIEIHRRQIAFKVWKRELELEKKEIDEINGTITTEETQENDVIREHHILGKCISDLGYKRIHLASAKNLASIPVWKRQRIYRHGRSKNMAADKVKTLHLGLPGIIGIFEDIDGGLNIIDGQHRIGMLKVLEEKITSDDFDFEKILVEVFPALNDQREEAYAKEIFLEVNKAEPVKLVDLPGVAKASDRKIINEVADRLHGGFPQMFSDSQRCRSPHLNIDNLRDALFGSNIIQKHSLKTSRSLEDWIVEQNELLVSKFKEEENRKSVSENALKKADKFRFYLGLESHWLYK